MADVSGSFNCDTFFNRGFTRINADQFFSDPRSFAFIRGLFQPVIGRFFGNDHVVNVRLLEPC
jgi:hypothetical protein